MDQKQNKWNKAGMAIGVISIIIGAVFILKPTDVPGYVESVTFGGDFYTEIHKASAVIASRLGAVIECLGLLQKGLGFAFVLSGALEIIFFGQKNAEAKAESGARKEFPVQEIPAAVPAALKKESADQWKTCRNCGANLEAYAEFCSECGAAQKEESVAE